MAGKLDWMAFGLPLEREEKTPFVVERLFLGWPVCRLTDMTADTKQRVRASGAAFCPILNEAGVVLGVVQKSDLEIERLVSVDEIMDPAPTTLRPNYSVDDATELLERNKQEAALVTSSDGKLLGVFKPGEAGGDRLK
jgi:CBS domain-containing protein